MSLYTLHFHISNIHCQSCVSKVQTLIENEFSECKQIDVNIVTSKLVVVFKGNFTYSIVQQIIHFMLSYGYQLTYLDDTDDRENLNYSEFTIKKLILSSILTIGIFITTYLKYSLISLILCIPIQFYIASPFLKDGLRKVYYHDFNMSVLVSISTFFPFLYSILVILDIVNGHEHFKAIAFIISFLVIGKYIEEISKKRAMKMLTKINNLRVKTVRVLKNKIISYIKINSVIKGDIVQVIAGELVPVDGRVIHGSCIVDQSKITGESLPRNIQVGDNIISGSVVIEGEVDFVSKSTGTDNTISNIINSIDSAYIFKSKHTNIINNLSKYFVPLILILSLITFVSWFIKLFYFDILSFYKSLDLSINYMIAVLVISCPCSIGIAVPLTSFLALDKFLSYFIIIKKVNVLFNIPKLDTIVFDKTGILTLGNIKVAKLIQYKSNFSKEQIIKLAGSLSKLSDHPCSLALSRKLMQLNKKFYDVKDYKPIIGYGIQGIVENYKVIFSSIKFLDKMDIKYSDEVKKSIVTFSDRYILSHISIDNKVVATICFEDQLVDSAYPLVKYLSNKYNLIVLSGDKESRLKHISKSLDNIKYISNCMPEDKLNYMKEYKKQGRTVMMIGDGMNDAPAIILSDIGVSIFNGNNIAIDSADIILMKLDLSLIKTIIMLGNLYNKKVYQNIFLTFIYNILFIPFAVLGLFTPIYASFSMFLSSTTVCINSLLFHYIGFNKS